MSNKYFINKTDPNYYEEGFYIFGGQNEKGVYLNDLWII
jgi:hypothetical protein